jgi:hypothetical protein
MENLFDPIHQGDAQNNQQRGAQMHIPINSPGTIANGNVDPYAAQTNDIVNLINTPFSSSDLMFGPSVSFFPTLDNTFPQNLVSPLQPTLSSLQPTLSPQQQQQQQQQQSADQTIFRHRPENPFWSVPTSLDFDAWNAYYQQRQQGDSGSMQMMNSNDNNNNNNANMWQ